MLGVRASRQVFIAYSYPSTLEKAEVGGNKVPYGSRCRTIRPFSPRRQSSSVLARTERPIFSSERSPGDSGPRMFSLRRVLLRTVQELGQHPPSLGIICIEQRVSDAKRTYFGSLATASVYCDDGVGVRSCG